VVIDPIRGDYGPRSLRPGGVLVSLSAPTENPLVPKARWCGVRAGFLLVEPGCAGLLGLSRLVDAVQLSVAVDAQMPLARAAKAHPGVAERRVSGSWQHAGVDGVEVGVDGIDPIRAGDGSRRLET
jgi:Zinc-binding dehydrogenase